MSISYDRVYLTFAVQDGNEYEADKQYYRVPVDASFIGVSPGELERELLTHNGSFPPLNVIETVSRRANWGGFSEVYEVIVTIASDPFINIFIGMLLESAKEKVVSLIDAKRLAGKAHSRADDREAQQ